MGTDRRKKVAANTSSDGKEKKTNKCCTEGSNPKEKKNMKTNQSFTLEISNTDKVCAIGDVFGRKCQKEKKIPG